MIKTERALNSLQGAYKKLWKSKLSFRRTKEIASGSGATNKPKPFKP